MNSLYSGLLTDVGVIIYWTEHEFGGQSRKRIWSGFYNGQFKVLNRVEFFRLKEVLADLGISLEKVEEAYGN